jgi:hypothetical protein
VKWGSGAKPPPALPERQARHDAPDAPDARVLALDIGLYGHRGSLSSMFWYRQGGVLHTHQAELLPEDATLTDQLDVMEAWAEAYPEYWQVSPVVVLGVTVLSHVGKRQVREHLDAWFNTPWRRRLVSIGDYAGEQAQIRALTSRKKLRDLLAARLSAHALTMTPGQHDAVAIYTGKREKPGRDEDDEWRTDETDALALPVALSCLAAAYLLPAPTATVEQHARRQASAAKAWQIEYGLPREEAVERARRQGPPQRATAPTPAGGAGPMGGSGVTLRLTPRPNLIDIEPREKPQ